MSLCLALSLYLIMDEFLGGCGWLWLWPLYFWEPLPSRERMKQIFVGSGLRGRIGLCQLWLCLWAVAVPVLCDHVALRPIHVTFRSSRWGQSPLVNVLYGDHCHGCGLWPWLWPPASAMALAVSIVVAAWPLRNISFRWGQRYARVQF